MKIIELFCILCTKSLQYTVFCTYSPSEIRLATCQVFNDCALDSTALEERKSHFFSFSIVWH